MACESIMKKLDIFNEGKLNKTGFINDPLNQTQSRRQFSFFLLENCIVLNDFEKGLTDRRTEDMCENSVHCLPRLWVGRVDQFKFDPTNDQSYKSNDF